MSQLTKQEGKNDVLRVLTLDGGGAKGFYTLGVLKEVEAMIDCLLYQKFDLVFGTKNIEMPHEENELAEMQDQVKELPRNPSAGVKRLGERLKLYPEDSTE